MIVNLDTMLIINTIPKIQQFQKLFFISLGSSSYVVQSTVCQFSFILDSVYRVVYFKLNQQRTTQMHEKLLTTDSVPDLLKTRDSHARNHSKGE